MNALLFASRVIMGNYNLALTLRCLKVSLNFFWCKFEYSMSLCYIHNILGCTDTLIFLLFDYIYGLIYLGYLRGFVSNQINSVYELVCCTKYKLIVVAFILGLFLRFISIFISFYGLRKMDHLFNYGKKIFSCFM